MAREIRNILINSIMDKALEDAAKKYLSGRLVDIGCGIKPYQKILSCYVKEHVGVDHIETFHDKSNVDLWGTAYTIPAADATFDCAICTAVLEHLEEPEKALRECNRILKPTGVAVYTVPFIWHLHEEPRDFYRFSKYGLRYLFEKTGFEIVELKALSGFWVTFGQLLVYYLYRLNWGPIRWLHIIDLIGLILQGGFFILEKIDKAEKWTWMYLVVARRKI